MPEPVLDLFIKRLRAKNFFIILRSLKTHLFLKTRTDVRQGIE